jgi:hypothetical protein
MRRSVAIDFDNTLAVTDFPIILSPIPEAIDFIHRCKEADIAVILWTCRTDKHLDEALTWCKEQGIEFDAVNANLPEAIKAYDECGYGVNPDGRKISVDLYLDDKAFLCWDKALDWLRRYD